MIEPLACARALVDCIGLAAVGNRQELDRRIVAEVALNDCRCPIGRAVVDDDHFKTGIGAAQNAFHRLGDDRGFVMRRDDDADLRQRAFEERFGPPCLADAMDEAKAGEEQHARKAEPDRADEHALQQMLRPAERIKHRAVDQRLEHARRQRRHRLLARQPGELGGRDKLKAARPQGVDQLRQSLDGFAPVAAGVVKQDDITDIVRIGIGDLLQDAVDDRLRRRRSQSSGSIRKPTLTKPMLCASATGTSSSIVVGSESPMKAPGTAASNGR